MNFRQTSIALDRCKPVTHFFKLPAMDQKCANVCKEIKIPVLEKFLFLESEISLRLSFLNFIIVMKKWRLQIE